MKRDLNKRLQALDKQSKDTAAVATYDPAGSAPVIQRMRDYLKTRGIEQGRMESLGEAFARALGISTTELRADLQGMAAGGR